MDTTDRTPWPPTLWTTDYEREPPRSFTPRFNRPGIPLSGEGVLLVPPDGVSVADLPEDAAVGHQTSMVITWAKEALRSSKRYYQLACLVNWTDWAIDKGEDWSPTEREVRDQLAVWWVSGQQAVEAYFHFQTWRKKIAGDDVDDVLRQLRNSLVHLDEAWLDDYSAHTVANQAGKPLKARDIKNLPGGQLPLAFHPGCIEALFAIIPLREVYHAASAYSAWPEDDRDWSDYEFDRDYEEPGP